MTALVARYRGLATLVLVAAEVLAVLVGAVIVADATHVSASTTRALVGLAGEGLRFGALVGLVVMVAGLHLEPLAEQSQGRAPGSALRGLHGAALLVLLGFCALVGATVSSGNPRVASTARELALLTMGLLALALATLAGARSMRTLPAPLARLTVRVFAAGCVAALVSSALYGWKPFFLQRWTVLAVDALVHRLFDDAICDLSIHAIGTKAFRVRIYPACSGVEGMTLGLLLVVPYLYVMRRELRFPRALVLVPTVLVALGLANVARIVLFIAYGRVASGRALEAFHSSIGWFLFVLTLLVVLPATERLFRLRRESEPSTHDDVPRNPAVPFLLPFIVSTSIAIVVAMLDAADSPFALGRYVLGALALVPFGSLSLYRDAPRRFAPVAAGLAVASLYVITTPEGAQASPLVLTTFRTAAPVLLFVHAIGYALVTPCVEELAFRGYLLRRLAGADFEGVAYADVGVVPIVISSVAFGFLHGDPVKAGLAGLVFAWAARTTSGLGGALVAHATANGSLVLLAWLTGRLGLVA